MHFDRDYLVYSLKSFENLTKVITFHFEKYNLITQKRADFELFKQIVSIKAKNRKLSLENFEKIISLKVKLNLGISEKLKQVFTNITSVLKPIVILQEIPHPKWLTGFIDGEGCFVINIDNYISPLTGRNIYNFCLTFFITQHTRDILLMESIVKYLDCGKVYQKSSHSVVDFKVGNFYNIINQIILFLQKYLLQSVKQKDYLDWFQASVLINNKEHLTAEGLEKIKRLKDGMNK